MELWKALKEIYNSNFQSVVLFDVCKEKIIEYRRF